MKQLLKRIIQGVLVLLTMAIVAFIFTASCRPNPLTDSRFWIAGGKK